MYENNHKPVADEADASSSVSVDQSTRLGGSVNDINLHGTHQASDAASEAPRRITRSIERECAPVILREPAMPEETETIIENEVEASERTMEPSEKEGEKTVVLAKGEPELLKQTTVNPESASAQIKHGEGTPEPESQSRLSQNQAEAKTKPDSRRWYNSISLVPNKFNEKRNEEKTETEAGVQPHRKEAQEDGTNGLDWDDCEIEIISHNSNSSAPPHVDVVAIHDIEETQQTAWIYYQGRGPAKSNTVKQPQDHDKASISSGQAGGKKDSASIKDEAPIRPPKPGAYKSDDTSGKNIRLLEYQKIESTSSGEHTTGELPRPMHGKDISKQHQLTKEARPSTKQSHLEPVKEQSETLPGEAPSVIVEQSEDIAKPPTTQGDRPRDARVRRRASSRTISGPSIQPIQTKETNVSDAPDDLLQSEKEPRSGRPSTEHGPERGINWLRDAKMLPKSISNTRIMAFTYPKPQSVNSVEPSKYLNKVAEQLISRLLQCREPYYYDKVPVVFVGHGFGCLILQRAIAMMAKKDPVTRPHGRMEEAMPRDC
ncbi:hypothetical protein F4821DRAFT_31355 [Hypoxylon rubiginosum]|uniref:Uncharacterized protein n=1 Tax=Hypoxylon rubiginosum TaxID=110542 RepID=A0ACC0CLP7_9PEZI|nr:hypothetical protein F4821DRAFT_31355 [Hypoxylon rubiginosum]